MKPLSPREKDVLQMTWDGLSQKDTAVALGISMNRVKNIRAKMAKKMGVSTSMQVVRLALEQGLISL